MVFNFKQKTHLAEQTFFMFGIDDEEDISSSSPKEAMPGRIHRDEQDVNKIQQQFIRSGVFETMTNDLNCLSTKDIASQQVKKDLLTARKRGKDKLFEFISKDLYTSSLDFYKPIKKIKSLTFCSLYQASTSGSQATSEKKEIKADRKLFQQLLTAKDTGRDISL